MSNAAVRTQLEATLVDGEPVGLGRHDLTAEERHDHVEALLHHPPLIVGIDAEHVGVGGELPGADTEHHAAARQVVEHHDAIGEDQRMVVRQ